MSMRELAVGVDDYVFACVPDYRRAVVTGIKTHEADLERIHDALSQTVEKWRSAPTPAASLPQVQRWRKAFRRVGLNPTRTRPAAEALIRRSQAAELSSFGDACVDVGAIVTLVHILPVGMHAVDDVGKELRLERATGEEVFATFNGKIEHPDPGEVIWSAGELVLTRHWVHRQGTAGSVNEQSTIFAINLDAIADDDLDGALTSMTYWLEVAGVSVTGTTVLDRVNAAGTVPA